MDRLEALGTQLSQITLYDVKSMYNQAKNIVLNVSEMEAKVREATNDDAWGASSTLMQEIAAGTFNYQQFNEIMPCIYARFMEKEARQWRQIYKALQLLEYLIKHGSERTVDDARSHLSMIKMLRNFHYIDDKGKDQGINIRNRSREIAELLGDLDKVRMERRKAKQNKNKYVGTGNDGGMSFSSGGSRYGGFGSDSLGGGGGDSYGGGGGGGSSSFRDQSGSQGFDEYDAGDDDDRHTTGPPRSTMSPQRRTTGGGPPAAVPKAAEPAKPAVVDLIGGFDDDDLQSISTNKALPSVTPAADGDDFDDFVSAPTVAAAPVPAPVLAPAAPLAPMAVRNNVFDLIGAPSAAPAARPMAAVPMFPSQPMAGHRPSAPSIGSLGGMAAPSMQPAFSQPAFAPMMGQPMMQPALASPPAMSGQPPIAPVRPGQPAAPAKSSANFDDLWSMSLGSAAKPAAGTPATSKSIKDLEREKAQASIWGTGTSNTTQANTAWSYSATGGASAGSGGDDLLL